MSRDIIKELKNLKNSREAGWVSSDVKERNRAHLMEAIQHNETEDAGYAFKGAIAYYHWVVNEFISKPVFVGAMAFVLLLGGWMTSVNAASNSLPGDTFYSLKLAAEQARLQLASSETRAILHTEFAQRRYEEALAIGVSPERHVYFEQTLDAFKEQIDLANVSLQELREMGSEETVKVASAVDQKIEELNAVIDGDGSQPKDMERASKVADARETTRQTEIAVVDAIVGSHEDAKPSVSNQDLEKLFREELTELRSREAFDLGRLAVIQDTIAANQEVLGSIELPVGESLNVIEFNITEAGTNASEASNLFAASGYRAAFDILRDANAELLTIENQLARIEITIMNALAEAKNAQETEDGEQTAESSESDASTSESTTNTTDSPPGDD